MIRFFYGIVEDRNDPLQIGRVRVRVHSVHTDNKTQLASADLPWSTVILPTTAIGFSGFGHGHSLVEGSTVFGMFRDDDMQDFVVMGVNMGINQTGYKETITGELLDRSVDKGFNDPRRTDYSGTLDGLNPPELPSRGNELTLKIEHSPRLPKALEIDYKGKGSKIEESSDSELFDGTRPYYPLKDYENESDLNRFAKGGAIYTQFDDLPNLGDFKPDRSKTLYPFNKVHHTESGHMIEMDDSVGGERLAVSHRSGTFYEIHKDGTEVHRVVNDNYTVICKDDNVYIGGKCNVKILGDATIDIGGDAKIDIDGKADIHSDKAMKISSSISTTITAPLVDINGKTVKLNS